MMFRSLAIGALAAPLVLGSIIPSPQSILSSVDALLHPDTGASLLEVTPDYFDSVANKNRKLCVLHPLGDERDDSDNFVKAVSECGRGGIVRLPDANYTIGQPLQIELHDSTLDLHGWLSFTADVEYWIKNRIVFPFQNQSLAFVIRGENFVLDGNDKGGIDGNGQVWYNYAKDFGNKFGRPMSLAISNAKNVVIKNFSIIQPQFWASIIIESENVLIQDFYVNATSFNPESKGDQKNWLQNTDGCDTYKSKNVTFQNMVYQGGDDCIALKPNSTDITVRNVTCFGGTGIAFGSIAQYEGVTDIIENVHMEDIKLYPSTQCPGYQGVYWKSWIGFSYGSPPNGGGGGEGYCRNVTVKDVYMEDIWHPLVIQTSLTYIPDIDRGLDTGKFEWSDIHLSNFTGNALQNRVVWFDCSKNKPCFNWTFEDINIRPGKEDHPDIHYVCNNIILGGKDGLNQCHPSSSKLETDNGGTL